MSDLDLAAIRARADAATDEVIRLTGQGERFRMSIPGNPKRDSDLLLIDSLNDIPALLDAILVSATPTDT